MVHPPPLNLSLIVLLFSVLDKNLMLSSSQVFSKFYFWIENTVFIVQHLIYELLLVPIIYIRVFFDIMK